MEQDYFHRRNLPHLYSEEGTYFITYRLKDSLPLEFLKQIHQELFSRKDKLGPKEKKIFKKYDGILDSGCYGNKYLNIPEIAKINQDILHTYDDKEYFLICYCIMPNHIHLVFNLLKNNSGISKIMQLIKGNSAIKSNSILNKNGTFWQDESFDRLVRDEKELYNIIEYVINNPVKAGLVENWQDWKYTYLYKPYQ
ncbi:MAG: transposase [Ignavibacteriaceae bacterium]